MPSTRSETGPQGPFALVDCNNFYVSCERVFQPELRDRPVVVLSNNDGCVIAKSDEADALGFEVAQPFFEMKEKVRGHDVAVRSSNYTLYADLSRRVKQTLRTFTPKLESYSIDEVFLGLDAFPGRDLTAYARKIAGTVERWTGIPVSIAVAPTKTLTKVALDVAKRTGRESVQNVHEWDSVDEVLRNVDVEAVWGIGSAHAGTCREHGLETARDLKQADARWVKDHLTVTGLRRKRELQGRPCIQLEDVPDPRDHVSCSRMFGETLTAFEPIREAVGTYVSRAAQRLRDQGQCAGYVEVFLRTSRFDDGEPHKQQTLKGFNQPTDATHVLAERAVECLRTIYRADRRYHKAGVVLGDLVPRERVQRSLVSAEASTGDETLMSTIDAINRKHGRDALQLAGAGLEKGWHMKRDHLSSRYTTCWDELPEVQAGRA